MKITNTKSWHGLRRTSPAWSMALLLALAVSVWGMHYKLSLYYPAPHSRDAVAKLLSEKERPQAGLHFEHVVACGKSLTCAHRPTLAPTFAACILFSLSGRIPDRRLLPNPHDGPHAPLLLVAGPSASRPPPIAG